jgi:DNA-binding NarL/FixJ family response regulator
VHSEPIVGRADQLRVLDEVVAELMRATATACVISGDAGMGKSTLWRYGVCRARAAGCRVLSCEMAEPAAMPFAGLIDLLDPVVEVLGSLPLPQRHVLEVALLRAAPGPVPPAGQAIGVAVLSVLRRLLAEGPVLIAVDDAHHLDPGTAAVLGHLGRHLGDAPVGLMIAADGREPVDGPDPLRAWRSVVPGGMRSIRADRLDAPDLRRLIRSRTGLALSRRQLLRLHDACGGNPSTALQFADAMRSGEAGVPGGPLAVPRRPRERMAALLRTLPPPARTLLLYAVAMDKPTLRAIRAALDTRDPVIPGLARAEQTGLVRCDHGAVRFTDPLAAAALYAAATGEARRVVHGRLAQVVGDLEQQARHLALAVEDEVAAVADVVDRAARHAEHREAPGVAADLWTLASQRTPVADGRRAGRLVAAARCLLQTGDSVAARMMLEQALAMPPGPARGPALIWLATVTFYHQGAARAVSLLGDTLPLVAADPALSAQVLLRLAWFAEHEPPLRLAYAQAAVRHAGHPGTPAPLRVAAARVVAYLESLTGTAVTPTVRGDPAGTPGGEWWWETDVATCAAIAGCAMDDLPAARAAWQARVRQARQVGGEAAVPQLLYHLAQVECWLGEWVTATRHIEDLIDAVQQTGQYWMHGRALYLRALVAAYQGNCALAEAAVADGLSVAEQLADPVARALHLAVRGFLDLSRGDAQAAEQHLARAAGPLEATGPAGFLVAADRIEATAASGAWRRAADLLAALRRRAPAATHPWLRPVLARAAAQVAMAAGDLTAAAAVLNEASSAYPLLPVPLELARTRLVHGQILRRMRHRRAAEQTLRQVRAAFAQLGATLWMPRVDAELHRVGLHRTAEGQLTPAESQVAHLVAAGRSNGEVAAALVISRRTVENHLCRIYRKLGVAARADLPAALPPGGRPHS